MENNDSNIKPQSTGGLKLMTVFVVVLALHVVVISGFCLYYAFKPGSPDADVLADKLHKSVAPLADNAMPSDSPTSDTGDKSTLLPATPQDVTSTNPTPAEPMVVSDSSVTPNPATPTASTDTTATPPVTPAVTTPLDSSVSHQMATATPVADITPAPVTPVVNPLTPPIDPTPAPVTGTTATATTASADSTYIVKHGDVLERIAHQHHMGLAKLMAANNLKSDALHIGQKLTIPAATPSTAATTTATSAPVASSDKTASVKPVATSVTKTKETKPVATNIKPKSKTAVAATATAAKPGYYTVMKGDNLTKIAHKFKTTPHAIMTANNLTDPKKLSIGTKLKIPSKEARSAKIAEPSDKPAQDQASATPATTTQLANINQ